jgi:predicted cupin superfamily sugar epimerase
MSTTLAATAPAASIVAQLIAHHQLKALPVEGVLLSNSYRSAYASAIIGLYCTEPPSYSSFHRLDSDELWHFYQGDPLRLLLLAPDGSSREVLLGPDWAAGQVRQCLVPAGTWQAGELCPGGHYALFGCTMAPGFRAAGFEGGTAAVLLAQYPERHDDILRLLPKAEASTFPLDFRD